MKNRKLKDLFPVSIKDTGKTILIFIVTTILCFLLSTMNTSNTYASMLFLLAVVMISRVTTGYFYGTIAAFLGMFAVNYIFTYPYFAFNFTISGYPVTFVSMLIVSIVVSTMTTQLMEQEKLRAAAQQEKMRGNLLRAISHDLRTPLTSISGVTSILLEKGDEISDEKRDALLRDVEQETQWLIRMVENLLSITRFQEGVAKITKQDEAVEEIVGEVVGKFTKRYGFLPVHISIPEELFLVPMDPMLIEQVIFNLLENAAKHAKGATRVELRVKKELEYAVFEVWDDGPGIDPTQLPHIFQGYFQQAENFSDSGRNMGVGLSVCKSIIEAHGGKVEAENEPAGGIAFRFCLPLKEE